MREVRIEMLKPPIIPRLVRAKLCDYNPLFRDTIEFAINHNQFLILGGNGLGKTTILQSIIYCIAGEADSDIEKEKSNRWGRHPFIHQKYYGVNMLPTICSKWLI